MYTTSKSELDLPVRYEMMGYDTLLGSHYDKYYLDYNMESYKPEPTPDKMFNVSGKIYQ